MTRSVHSVLNLAPERFPLSRQSAQLIGFFGKVARQHLEQQNFGIQRSQQPVLHFSAGQHLSIDVQCSSAINSVLIGFFRAHGGIMLRRSEKAKLLGLLVIGLVALALIAGNRAGWW